MSRQAASNNDSLPPHPSRQHNNLSRKNSVRSKPNGQTYTLELSRQFHFSARHHCAHRDTFFRSGTENRLSQVLFRTAIRSTERERLVSEVSPRFHGLPPELKPPADVCGPPNHSFQDYYLCFEPRLPSLPGRTRFQVILSQRLTTFAALIRHLAQQCWLLVGFLRRRKTTERERDGY